MTSRELADDYRRISKLAKDLSLALERHSGQFHLMQDYRFLIPTANHERIQEILHPDLVASFKRKGHPRVDVLDQVLPPLFVLLEILAAKTAEVEPPRLPRKAKSQSALRIHLLDAIYWTIRNRKKFSSAHCSQFLAVALDDDSITDATVRMAARSRNWWHLANDCEEI